MNKLSYGLLSLLSVEKMSGYDLTQKINLFWHTNHSAIYPILFELENNGFVTCVIIPQKGKPDKKIYEATALGLEKLRAWVLEGLNPAVKKDELTLKIFCLKNLDEESVDRFLELVEKRSQRRLEKLSSFLESYRDHYNDNHDIFEMDRIGSILLVRKGIEEARLELEWGRWIKKMSQIEKSGVRISRKMLFEDSFTGEVQGSGGEYNPS